MDIEELKKQEDLKTVLADLLNEIGSKIAEKTKAYVRDAEKDFRQYFVEKGFAVRKDEATTIATIIIANHGKLSAELKHDKESSNYMGSHFVFDLTTTLSDKAVYSVSLHSGSSSSAIMYRGSSPEENLLREIEEQKARLENIENEIWGFRLKKETGFTSTKQIAKVSPIFASMYEVLASIAK